MPPPPPERPSPPPPEPDLIITEVWLDWTEKEDIIINYLIENRAEVEAGASLTYLYYEGEVIRKDEVGPLPPGQSMERFFLPHEFPETGFEVELRADAVNSVIESDEKNNYRWYGYGG